MLKWYGGENVSFISGVARTLVNRNYEKNEWTGLVLNQQETRVCSETNTYFQMHNC
jgi:hypothetical protein